MGLTIYYSLKKKTDAAGARKLVKRLHAFARTLPFDSVSDVEEYDPPDGRFVFERGERPEPWKPGGRYLTRKRDDGQEECVHVPSLHAMSFMANIAGSETAEFGLATHPPVVIHNEEIITQSDGGSEHRIGAGPTVEFPTRLRGWYSFSSFCKTQYAANPTCGGVPNFLRAHLSVFRMIDEAKRIGMTTHIRDDAKYWRNRSEDKLIAELRKWDELIAGFTGKLSDLMAPEAGKIVAPIKDRPDFEHLEAKGAQRFAQDASRRKPSASKKRRRPESGN